MTMIPATTAPRALTSPSNLLRRRLCPGSARLEAQIPHEDADSEYSEEGKLLHLHYADKTLDRLPLKPAQREVLEIADRAQLETIRLSVQEAGIPEDAPFLEGYEKPLVFNANGSTVFPGTCDYWRHYYSHDVLIIEDAKFGYITVTSAEGNLQLAAYALMASDEMANAKVFAAINQPRAPFEDRRTMAVYPAESMPSVRAEILRILAACEAPDAPLRASDDACRHCRAKEVCPAFRERVLQLAEVQRDSFLSLPADEFLRIGQAIKLAALIHDDFSKEAARRIEAGELPGWSFKNNGSVSSITDLMAAYQRFAEAFGEKYEETPGQLALDFMACMSVRWGPVTALVAKLDGSSEKKAKARLAEIWAGLVEKTEKAKSVVLPKE